MRTTSAPANGVAALATHSGNPGTGPHSGNPRVGAQSGEFRADLVEFRFGALSAGAPVCARLLYDLGAGVKDTAQFVSFPSSVGTGAIESLGGV